MNARILKCAKLLLRVWCGWFYSRYCSLTLAWFKTIWTAELLSARSQYGNAIVLQSYCGNISRGKFKSRSWVSTNTVKHYIYNIQTVPAKARS